MGLSKEDNHGQNIIEYTMLFAVILIVIISVLSFSSGFFPRQVGESLDVSMEAIECAAVAVCYDPDPLTNRVFPHPCPPVCRDGCCQEGEEASCPEDC